MCSSASMLLMCDCIVQIWVIRQVFSPLPMAKNSEPMMVGAWGSGHIPLSCAHTARELIIQIESSLSLHVERAQCQPCIHMYICMYVCHNNYYSGDKQGPNFTYTYYTLFHAIFFFIYVPTSLLCKKCKPAAIKNSPLTWSGWMFVAEIVKILSSYLSIIKSFRHKSV